MANSISIGIELEGKNALRTLTALEKGFTNLGKTGTRSVSSITKATDVLKGVIGAQAIIRGIDLVGRAFRQATRDALDFSKAIAEINTIVPRSAEETLALKQQLLALSSEYGNSAQGQARAFYNILSAGITDTASALVLLEQSNKAAAAGVTDVDSAARGLISVINSYTDGSINAVEASDILFTAVREGRTTFGELADTIGRVSSIASSVGVGFDELAGTIAFVTKSGIRTDEAVIGLRQAINGLIEPTEEAKQEFKALGIEYGASALASRGVAGILTQIREATGGNAQAIKRLIPNIRAYNVAIKIAGGDIEDFNRILAETARATGATDKAFSTVADSAAFQFEKLTTQLRNFPTAILTNFEEPIVDALKVINEFVSTQGILSIVDAVELVIDSFNFFLTAINRVEQGLNFASNVVLNSALAWNEYKLAVNQVQQGIRDFLGLGGQVTEEFKKEEEQIRRNIEVLNNSIAVNERANAELIKSDEDRTKKVEAFREKLNEGRRKQVELNRQANEQELADNNAADSKKTENALAAEEERFNAIQELKAANLELEKEREEEEKLGRELAAEEEFQFLADNLGRQNALRELKRIENIDNEKKRQVELKKLREKAEKEERASILSIRKFEDLSNKEKIAAQKQTLQTISTLTTSTNSTLFAIGKASSLALAGINTAEGVTKALAAFPPPFNFAAAAAVGAAGAVQIARIAAQQPPSAGSFQQGGIITGPSQTGDQLTANVNDGEAIFNRRQQENLFRAINNNNINGSGGNISINIQSLTGDIPQESIDNLVDQLNDASEFRNKNLIGAA